MKISKMFIRTAIVYVRVYSKESLNLYGIDEQEKAVIDYASKNSYRVLRIFREENISARNFDRPVFGEMIDYIKANQLKVKFLLVMDRTRLSANPVGLRKLGWFLKTKGIRVISIVQSLLKHHTEHLKQHS